MVAFSVLGIRLETPGVMQQALMLNVDVFCDKITNRVTHILERSAAS
jgi:hypothetical protein